MGPLPVQVSEATPAGRYAGSGRREAANPRSSVQQRRSYLDALDHIHKLDPGTVGTVALVLFFCLMQQVFLELPLLGYLFAPDRTQDTVRRFRAWMERSGRTAAVIGAGAIGILLLVRGTITLL